MGVGLDLFDLKGKTALVLGGAGILGVDICKGLADFNGNIAVADLSEERAVALAGEISSKTTAKGYAVDAMSSESLNKLKSAVLADFGKVDILINAVGGNMKDATVSDEKDFFHLSEAALKKVIDLNLFGGAILPSQIFGEAMKDNPEGGVILNVSSMSAFKPLTRIAGYSAAKAAVSNFTFWLAVYMAQAGYTKIRVNAIAPGFFLTEQNRFLLTDEKTGELTERGKAIIAHTPMNRFGQPDDLIGAVVWLVSNASQFVTGVVVPIDGGFSAFAGV